MFAAAPPRSEPEVAHVVVRRPAPAGSAAILGRWRPVKIEDREAFLRDHPECRLTEAAYQELKSAIKSRINKLDPSGTKERKADLETDILTGILDSATHYRETDPTTGQPIFDFLAQSKGYIVQHASHRACTMLRHERDASKNEMPFPTAALVSEFHAGGGPNDMVPTPDPLDSSGAFAVDNVDTVNLRTALEAQLTPSQMRTLEIVLDGGRRSDVVAITGLARQRVHEHMLAIRAAYLAAEPSARQKVMRLLPSPDARPSVMTTVVRIDRKRTAA